MSSRATLIDYLRFAIVRSPFAQHEIRFTSHEQRIKIGFVYSLP
jgi:hypothetical protein